MTTSDDTCGRFEEVASIDALDAAMRRAEDGPVVLFNHDPWCPVSARAHRIVSATDIPVSIVDVSRHRDVTAAIAERTGVRHESPQVIVLRGREVVWTASHMRITADAILEALHESASVPD